MDFYIGKIFVGEYPPEAAEWCNGNGAYIEEIEAADGQRRFQVLEVPPPEITPADYDRAMEEHIKAARVSRGYTTREPTEYLGSSVPRWAQDATDYIAFRDACMLYGLQVQNDYAAGKEVPTLEEFKANLPDVIWTYTEEQTEGE